MKCDSHSWSVSGRYKFHFLSALKKGVLAVTQNFIKKMSKIINNKFLSFLGGMIYILLILSCRQRESRNDSRLVFEKSNDVSSRVIGAVINGKKQGLWINYDDSGRIESFNTYVDDSLTGESISYFEDGEVSSIGEVKNGQPEGKWSFFYGKGKLAETGVYRNGRKTGVWEFYIEEGGLDKKVEYSKGQVKKIILDNHLTLPVLEFDKPSTNLDSKNHAVVE